MTATAPEDVAATFCATLVDEWIEHGVRVAVIAPGSRSTPLALALAARSELVPHVLHDERSASFVALGVGLASGVPAILLCTSGTAATHFHAAVVEAHLSGVPMLVCTADRPPELRDVGAPQTIDQTKLYGDVVRWFHDPGIADVVAAPTWRGLAAHAFALATGARPGPVHLNLPFREPLVGVAAPLPARRGVGRVSSSPELHADAVGRQEVLDLCDGRRGVIVAGRGCGRPRAVHELAVQAGWPIVADARSGLRHLADVAVSAADHVLRDAAFAAEMQPEVVLRLGEPPASKVLNQWLARADAPQVHVGASPSWTDPDGILSKRIEADPSMLCRDLTARIETTSSPWLESWLTAEREAQLALDVALRDAPLTEPAVARWLATMLPELARLVVSSSMPIRDIEWFGLIPEGVVVFSNRGANGIDGVVATAIGVAAATMLPTAVLIGDVAFLHDSSSLTALASRGLDVRIVVVDNDGGGIFSFLPQASSLASDRFELLFGTPHGTDIPALALAHGLRTRTVATLDELRHALSAPGPSVTHVRSNRAANVATHDRLNALRTAP
jgi:2-succinyl-5-enolpyruvyl-6-hydroxy-3-cyclohexene-1-carboxylate synthase